MHPDNYFCFINSLFPYQIISFLGNFNNFVLLLSIVSHSPIWTQNPRLSIFSEWNFIQVGIASCNSYAPHTCTSRHKNKWTEFKKNSEFNFHYFTKYTICIVLLNIMCIIYIVKILYIFLLNIEHQCIFT